MAITISKEPGRLNFTEEPVVIVASTNKYVLNNGTKYQFALKFNNTTATVGEGIYFGDCPLFPAIFLHVSPLSQAGCIAADMGHIVPTYVASGAGSISAWRNIWYNLILRNYYLEKHFDIITTGTDKILFTAKNVGTDYACAISVGGISGFSLTDFVAAANKEYNPNYYMVCDVIVVDPLDSLIKVIGQITSIPDKFNICRFNLQSILHAYMLVDDAPFVADLSSDCTNINFEFNYRLTEWLNEIGRTGLNYQSSIQPFAIKGGRKLPHYIAEPIPGNIYFYNQMWLTTTGETLVRVTTQTQCSQWLYFFGFGMGDAPKAKCKLYYTDGLDETFTLETLGIIDYHTIRIRTDYMHPAIQAMVSTSLVPVSKYEVWIENESNVLVKKKITYLIEEPYFNERCFYFEASMGGFRTLRCKGSEEYGIQVDAEEFRVLLEVPHKNEFNKNLLNRLNHFTDEFESFSGFMSKYELRNIVRDFLISEQVYTTSEDGVQTVAVNLIPDSFSLVRTDDYQYGVKFKWHFANTHINHSNLLT